MCSLCTIVCSATALTSQRTQTVAFGSQVVTRMGYYVQGDKIKLQVIFSTGQHACRIMYREIRLSCGFISSTGSADFRWTVCSLHKYRDSILSHNLHDSSRSAAFAATQIGRESGFARCSSVYCFPSAGSMRCI